MKLRLHYYEASLLQNMKLLIKICFLVSEKINQSGFFSNNNHRRVYLNRTLSGQHINIFILVRIKLPRENFIL